MLGLYQFPGLEAQAFDRWLGGGENGGAAGALTATAEFLKGQRKVRAQSDDHSRHCKPWVVKMVLSNKC